MRILITGSREFSDWNILMDAIAYEFPRDPYEPVTVVHGDCPSGADNMAHWYVEDLNDTVQAEPHPADWEAPCRSTCKPGHRRANDTCPAAGHYRNQEMVDLGADVCLAFFKEGAANRGTKDCAARAEKAGIPVRKFYER